jgi:hypothetical protein
LLLLFFSDPETVLALSDAPDLAFWPSCNSGSGSILFR